MAKANWTLYKRQQEEENLRGMGTTLTVCWFGEKKVLVGHVGDSRCYLLRDGTLQQVTEDHSMVAEMVRAGLITKTEAENHPMRNVITRAVGTEESTLIDTMQEERKPGDLWLLCSDGLYGMVKEAEMEEILKNHSPKEAAALLMDAAMEAGGKDNISLVILLDKEAEA